MWTSACLSLPYSVHTDRDIPLFGDASRISPDSKTMGKYHKKSWGPNPIGEFELTWQWERPADNVIHNRQIKLVLSRTSPPHYINDDHHLHLPVLISLQALHWCFNHLLLLVQFFWIWMPMALQASLLPPLHIHKEVVQYRGTAKIHYLHASIFSTWMVSKYPSSLSFFLFPKTCRRNPMLPLKMLQLSLESHSPTISNPTSALWYWRARYGFGPFFFFFFFSCSLVQFRTWKRK